MATATASQRTVISRAASTPVEVAAPSRREFLYYIWGASIVLLLGEATAGLIWFMLPRFKEGTFGGIFNYPPAEVPSANSAPVNVPEGRFWVSNVANEGFIILYAVCTHLGCLPNGRRVTIALNAPVMAPNFSLTADTSKVQHRAVWIASAPRSRSRMARRL